MKYLTRGFANSVGYVIQSKRSCVQEISVKISTERATYQRRLNPTVQ